MGTLHEKINALCKSKGVSGSRMCLDLGLSKSTMSDLKHGRTKGFSITTAKKIAGYFGITVDELYGEQKETPDQLVLTGVDKELYELLRQIPDEQKKLFLEMGRVFVNNLNKD